MIDTVFYLLTVAYHTIEIVATGDFAPHTFLPAPIFEDDPALNPAYTVRGFMVGW
ncbi:hypothetical protein SEA_DARWIN_98 [Corynebacterium phage Darwin]|uniref:Uncharacterized protein n=1 Tax=Corynebacterium phage Darwin TaxID=2047869 RepID=A0A2H4P8N3_9CAUD|nr:hypothetical protein FDJ11_gp50 [Corynebacterium phage Darwin]ATW58550.1 hypothetical protein SEA_DARWIN_98 [Corynebacterium phage Darwin]